MGRGCRTLLCLPPAFSEELVLVLVKMLSPGKCVSDDGLSLEGLTSLS